jgi:tetratricopeptide (TPR) repeat protein
MNLAIIERMVRQGDMSREALRYLIEAHGECEWLDYKEHLEATHDARVCELGRDTLAMKNVGGGYLVIGVKDQTWAPTGLQRPLPLDTKLLRDQIRRATGLDLDADIVHHDLVFEDQRRTFALVLVRASRKRSKRRAPSLVAKDFCHNKPYGLRRGEIYLRKGDQTVRIHSHEELEDLLDRLESEADNSALMISAEAPFAVVDGTYRLLEKGFQSFIGRDHLRKQLLEAVLKDPRIWIINVHGPGGVGKSALVNWATYEFYGTRQFEGIIHLTAKDTQLTAGGIKPFSRSLYSLEDLLRNILITYEQAVPESLDDMRSAAREVLSAWSTLLVLDNMETVGDGRILSFVQQLPTDTKAKVLLTSRLKTGGWELPVPVMELNRDEVAEFVSIKSVEMSVDFPLDRDAVDKTWRASGGLPLALQWMIGYYKFVRDIDKVTSAVINRDSPVLEFSFRNIWNVLAPDSKAVLGILTIFDNPPTAQDIAIATEWPTDRIDNALNELIDVTLVTRSLHSSDGRWVFVALPITLSFARHQLDSMGDFETKCRQRMQHFNDQMTLQQSEVSRFKGVFEQYGLDTDNEKRAAILCRRGESEVFTGRIEDADNLFRQARELAPQSAYVYALSASFEQARNKLGVALGYAKEACARATKKTGALAYSILARVLDAQHDKTGRLEALEHAVAFAPTDVVLKHQYGVALSRVGHTARAIDVFSEIISAEESRVPARDTLLMALKTRIINLRRANRPKEADDDLALAKRVLAQNPHLGHQADEIRELEEE